MKRICAILLSLLLMASLLTACGTQAGIQDGYYTAQASEFSHGWKEYVTILVKGGNCLGGVQCGEPQRLHQELG